MGLIFGVILGGKQFKRNRENPSTAELQDKVHGVVTVTTQLVVTLVPASTVVLEFPQSYDRGYIL